MKPNVFDETLPDGRVRVFSIVNGVSATGTDLKDAARNFVRAYLDRYHVPPRLVAADEPADPPYVHRPGCPGPLHCNCYPTG